ncbi:helix-turn-helix domain-containing protein [Lysinibacillus sp. NPDC093712]|uniref:helix-turn-helix domain-containing protein n=1 Tax=Lysinibacillus sp. NPDC093712 TaxID=3390579 RepID=UPI003CFF6CE2
MVKSNLPVLMAERYLKITTLSEKTGISRTTLTKLYYSKAKGIQFRTLVALCKFLDCEVGELLEIEKEAV